MKELIDFLSGRLDIANKALLEKDVYLQRILSRLMRTSFKDSYVFKGGTCLTKCHFGYYRFSEDLDFTHINQKEFKDKSQKQLRKQLSKKIDEFMQILTDIAKEVNLDFKASKADKKYVELGGSNKFATFRLWYVSDVLKKEQFVKIQINYVELFKNKIVSKKASSLYSKIPKQELELLFPEYVEIRETISLRCYPLKEIMFEKIRAILTRKGMKSRDFIDAYLIMKKTKISLKKEEKAIVEKIRFMLKYDKYVQNLSVFDADKIVLEDEQKLLLIPIDEGFKAFLDTFLPYLKDIRGKIK